MTSLWGGFVFVILYFLWLIHLSNLIQNLVVVSFPPFSLYFLYTSCFVTLESLSYSRLSSKKFTKSSPTATLTPSLIDWLITLFVELTTLSHKGSLKLLPTISLKYSRGPVRKMRIYNVKHCFLVYLLNSSYFYTIQN